MTNRFAQKLTGLVVVLATLIPILSHAQICSDDTPLFQVDLTGDPEGLFLTPLVVRQGNCCGTEFPNRCIQFSIVLDEQAIGLSFDIYEGAVPPGALFYQIDCGDSTMVGEQICLEGGVEHTLTFCKPGNNPNVYGIQSVPARIQVDSVVTRVDCPAEIRVEGAVDSTITWNDITSSDGSYNGYLSCTQACSLAVVTPDQNAPPEIRYEVCGLFVPAICPANARTVCDTVLVEVLPAVELQVTPDDPVFCDGETPTMNASGSPPGLTFEWYNGATGALLGTGSSYTGSGPVTVVATDTAFVGCNSDTVNLEVIVQPPIEMAVPTGGEICVGDVLSFTVPSNLDYVWNTQTGVDTSQFPTILLSPASTTQYLLTASDEAGCSREFNFTLQVDPAPVVQAGPPLTLTCESPSGILAGQVIESQPGISIQWTGPPGGIQSGGNTLSPAVNAPGWYFLQVSSGSENCASIDSVLVTTDFNSAAVILPESLVIACDEESVLVDGTGSTSGPGVTYTWSGPGGPLPNPGNSAQWTATEAGWYFLTVTNPANGCDGVDSVEVEVYSPPEGLTLTTSSTCPGTTQGQVLVEAVDGGTPPFQYSLNGSPFFNANSFTGLSPGSYTLTVRDANGCEWTETAEIGERPVPLAEAGPPVTLDCNNPQGVLSAQISGNQPGTTFQWFGPAGGILSGENTFTPEVGSPGWYFLQVSTNLPGCSSLDSVQVTGDFLSAAVIIPEYLEIDCEEEEVMIDASESTTGPGVTYNWLGPNGFLPNPDNAPRITVTEGGWYHLTVTNPGNGCEDLDSVEVASFPAVEGLALTNGSSCPEAEQGQISIGAVTGGTPPYLFSLNGSPFADINGFSGLAPGAYTVSVQDVNGCEWTETAEVEALEVLPLILTAGVDLTLGDTVQLNAQLNGFEFLLDSLYWSPPEGLSCTDCLDPLASPLMTTTYTVTAVGENGCPASASVLVTVDDGSPAYIPTAFTPNGDNINETWVIYTGPAVEEIRDLKIFDRWGNLVFSTRNIPPNDPSFGWDGTFEGQPMNQAVFAFFTVLKMADGREVLLEGDFTLLR